MFFSEQAREAGAKLAAIDRAQAVIEFDLAGTILTANANFLETIGYGLSELVGQHHGLLVESEYRASPEYIAFWERLRAGEFQAGQFRRLAKGGREVWIEATYNPVLGRDGKPYKVIKFATDITRRMREDAIRASRLAAIDKSHAVIAFDLDGTVLEANANFLATMGYGEDEVVGRHHRLFVDQDTSKSDAYAAFWERLRAGEFQAGQFRRLAKGGKEVWIEATYNPVLDAAGRPFQVVKYASDITAQMTLLADLRRLIETNFSEIDAAVARTDQEAGEAANAAAIGGDRVKAMAAAVGEMASKVDGIAAEMAEAEAAADRAAGEVAAAGEQTRLLAEAAASMSGIVAVIRSVAGQINLLALNATIEAARAGAAGRGFAVVAGEVKALAEQTAKATDQIHGEIAGVQEATGHVVGALASIQGSTETLRVGASSAAAAALEQSAGARQLLADVQGVAQTVSVITGNVAAIEAAVGAVSGAVATTKGAARVLAR